jgi:hypothetical protein
MFLKTDISAGTLRGSARLSALPITRSIWPGTLRKRAGRSGARLRQAFGAAGPRPTNADTPKRRYSFFAIAAWAAAKRAIGNRNGLQLT